MTEPIVFEAEIIRHEQQDAGFIEFPFDTKTVFGRSNIIKVDVLFDDSVRYRGSLANMGKGCHILVVTKAVRAQLGKSIGEIVKVSMIEDTMPREVIVPEDVQEVLNTFPEARLTFENMSYSHRKENIEWIEAAKKAETRERRKEKMILMLLKRSDELKAKRK